MTASYFSPTSWALSRIAFLGTHLVFVYWLNFLLNDPFDLGGNTLDVKNPKDESVCRPFIRENFIFDLGLFALWWGTHSGFARKAYKVAAGLWAHPLERPLFATFAWTIWGLNVLFWRPITDCQRWYPTQVALNLLYVSVPIFAAGALLVVGLLWSLPDHVFGTSRCRFAPNAYEPKGSIIYNFPYGLVRHPAAAGFLYMFWSLPAYTLNHIFLSTVWTIFIVAGTAFEEGGLKSADSFGSDYVKYKSQVNAFIPKPSSIFKVFFGSSKKRVD